MKISIVMAVYNAEKFVNENVNSKFIGITNKKNLVFETKSGQVKITPNGEILWVI